MRTLYCILLAAALGACAPQTVATQPVLTAAPVLPTDTLIPAPTEAPTQIARLQPIALAGPPMQVGSMWPYVDGSILVAVPGGDFIMGHGGTDNPEHKVSLSDFWIYQAKVTNQQYALCVKTGTCKPPDAIDDFTFNDITHANDPVVGVNYQQASDYCTFVHGRLPTEAEWEKTARGPDGNLYPWGSNAPVCNVLNFNNCVGKITNTTAYPDGQSYYHALDTEGNVFEWVADWYDALYYKSGNAQDPLGPDSGQKRSVRSSSYKSKVEQIPASTRFAYDPREHRRDLGFRCVVEDPAYFAPLCQAISSSPGSVKTDCPKVNIGLTESCQKGLVTVVVLDDHSPDPGAAISGVGSCTPISVTPGSFPQIYSCTSDTTVGITTTCDYVASSPATCAAHFTLNASTGECEWDGSLTTGKACLSGLTYDPVHQCCTSPNSVTTEYPVCPLGSALGYASGKPVCIPGRDALNKPSHTEYVHVQDPATCTGGNPAGSCTLTDASCKSSCRYGGVFVPSTCSCVCYPG
jgi:formylglycine-generating enzyme required for sulfatase activity